MKKTTTLGLIKLTRYQEYLVFVTINTLLGFIFAHPTITITVLLRLIVVLIANMLSVCFSFMINDVEDAPDDALSPQKTIRNPISAGMLSRRVGLWASGGIAVVAMLAFYPLGTVPFILGIVTIGLGLLYSWKRIRLKSIPLLDLISHGLMLAGLQFLCSYFTFTTFKGFTPDLVLPLFLTTAVSMYGELYNEVRDFTYDKLAGINHTATMMGKANTHIAMYLLLSVAAVAILYSIFLHIVPMWFIVLYMIVGGLFFLSVLQAIFIHRQIPNTDIIQDYILLTTVISLCVWTGARILGF
jgi:4-hydroxybenzoate polyprenyltransferase